MIGDPDVVVHCDLGVGDIACAPETLAMDRYTIDGQVRDFVVAARELDPNEFWPCGQTTPTHQCGQVWSQVGGAWLKENRA